MPELRTPHVVVVAEVVEDPPMEKLDRVGAALEKHADVRLWTVRQKAVVGVLRRTAGESRQRVLHMLQDVIASEPIVLRLGLGGDSQGPETTPSSYSEANDAIRIGKAMFGNSQRVHDFNSLGQYGLALREPALAARWAASQLAECGPALKRRWALPTLESYLAHRGNQKAVAGELGVHVNTVKYRLSIIRRLLAVQLDDGEAASELLMAIRLNRIMNPRPADR
jgi:sugar diacid utilization regulator